MLTHSLFATLEEAKLSLMKTAAHAGEGVSVESFLNPSALTPTLHTDPFSHIVIDDVFTPPVYSALEKAFLEVLERGISFTTSDAERFSAFDIDYDGYRYTPDATIAEESPFSLFFSVAWNQFFSDIFGQKTTFETSLGFHHHPPGNRTGFVHNDFANKYFDTARHLANFVVPYELKPEENPGRKLVPRRRIIALLFYLAGNDWKEVDGGETGFYSGDKKELLKKVAPLNNRLLAFRVSQDSMHAFQENKTPRNCIVQWFHLPDFLM